MKHLPPISLTLTGQERKDMLEGLDYLIEHDGFDEDGNDPRFFNSLVRLHKRLAEGIGWRSTWDKIPRSQGGGQGAGWPSTTGNPSGGGRDNG